MTTFDNTLNADGALIVGAGLAGLFTALKLAGALYLAYLGVVIGCSALVGAAFAGTRWAYGGSIVLFSAAGMVATAALGSCDTG